MHCSQSTLEQGLRDSLYVDYRKKGSYFECTTVQAVKDVCEKVINIISIINEREKLDTLLLIIYCVDMT